jgi:hypothetical protein
MSELVAHLDRQVRSTRRLLGIVISQATAIRERDVETVLSKLGELQGEMVQRAQLEQERDGLMKRSAALLRIDPAEVDIDALVTLETPQDAVVARDLSAELKGLLAETARLHDRNRALIRQELSFLDHLMRMLSGTMRTGYSPDGMTRAPQALNAVNATA